MDTADTSTIPAGLHLAFTSTGRRFVVHFAVRAPHPFSPPTRPDAFTLWQGGEAVASAPAGDGPTAVLEIGEDGRDGAEEFALYFPEGTAERVDLLEADGSLEPVEDRPLILAYGDSIVQGWSTSDPGLTWPAIVGRALSAEMCNLGFAGAARGEVAVAEQMAAASRVPAAVILAFGTNSWTFPPTTPTAIAEAVRIFVGTLRAVWAETPIVIVSPIVRPDADRTPNRLGATLSDLRTAIEAVAREYDDVSLIRGLGVMDATSLVDGIHPGDEGHAAIAAAVIAALHRLSTTREK